MGLFESSNRLDYSIDSLWTELELFDYYYSTDSLCSAKVQCVIIMFSLIRGGFLNKYKPKKIEKCISNRV